MLVLLNLLVKSFWVLGIDRVVQNTVGAEQYGMYFSLYSYSILFTIFLDLGITNYNNRRIAEDPGQLPAVLANVFVIRLLFSIFYFGLTIAGAVIIGYNRLQMLMIMFLMINQFLASFTLYLRSNVTALQLFRTDSFLSVSDRFIMILLCSLLLWGGIAKGGFRIEWFVYVQTFAHCVTFIISLLVVLTRGRIRQVNLSFGFSLNILREAMPYALLALFTAVYWRIDSVMIERMLPDGKEEAGIYAQAFRLFDAGAMIPYLFSVILLPMLTRMMAEKMETWPVLRLAVVLLVIPALIVSVISLFHASFIMDLLYTGHVESSSRVLSIILCGYIPVSLIYLFSSYLTALGKVRLLYRVVFIGMVINITLNLILIPHMGISGSAIASVSSHLLICLILIFIIWHEIRSRELNMLIIQIVSNIVLLVICGFVLFRLETGDVLSLFILIISGIIFPLLTRFISYKNAWKQLIMGLK